MEDVHPIQDAPALPLERRVHLLECALGRLWDQVWWMQLSPEMRAEYEAQGFRAPIGNFYRPLEEILTDGRENLLPRERG